ncbi:hypothetical protein AB0I68_30075 [Streptomyces sp. NPDC050448]|uniref:hypothetical protein n=1 Tax=Streptomyces sp. NPDC050448 TaxID=3155404 RepID=UPI003449FE59
MPDLPDLLRYDRPRWIQPKPGEKAEDLERRLDAAHGHQPFDVAIVACNPVAQAYSLRIRCASDLNCRSAGGARRSTTDSSASPSWSR